MLENVLGRLPNPKPEKSSSFEQRNAYLTTSARFSVEVLKCYIFAMMSTFYPNSVINTI